MEQGFYDVFRFITIFQFIFFAFFLLTLKKGNTLSNKLFAFFLFSKALCFFHGLTFSFKEMFISISPHFFLIGESFEFLLGPALYFYALSLAYQNFTFKKSHLLHLIPFIIHLSFMSFKFHINPSEVKIELLAGYVLSLPEYLINISSIYIHFLVYSIATIRTISIYKRELKDIYSSIKKIQLTWLQLLVFGFVLIWGTAAINFVSQILGIGSFYPYGVSVVLLFIFANLIIYKGLKQPEIFNGISRLKKNGKSFLPEPDRINYLKQLNEIMEKDKPYLNPNLTLNELADKISMPARYLSYVINKSFNQNFYDYINSYRVAESKFLLSNKKDRKQTVLEILYDAGFNSKSVFNASFKKHAGMTPTQFIKSISP